MPNLSCGIVGLPNVGKSTLFNALTKQMVAASNFPFCTIDPNVGVVNVPDERLDALSKLTKSQKIVPATISFVDIAGLVKGASEGEGLGNQFLSNIRETDLIVQVVRCFEDENVIHVNGSIDPIHDIEIIQLELILSDLHTADKIYTKLEKNAKSAKEKPAVLTVLEKIRTHLNANQPIRTLSFTPEEKEALKPYPFLTAKPLLYCTNVSEKDLPSMENSYVEKVRAYAAKENIPVIPICARLEEELAGLSDTDAKEYLDSLGLTESGLSRLIRVSFASLDLITFYTAGEKESRAWTVHKGALAPEAAAAIHTDIQKGFIRAEVISYDDYIRYGGRVQAREAGKVRIEGKSYTVHGDDVILFFHN
jgi:GTP-binding protein YchF